MSTALNYITTPTVFRHVKRSEWGIGRVMSEGPYRRRIQFEDGQRRTFKREYYHLLEEVEAPSPEAKATLDTLVDEARAAMGSRTNKRKRRSAVDATEALAAQIKTFRDEFGHGFQDPKWKGDVRGVGASRPLKRHRDAIAESGPALLAPDNLRAELEAGNGPAVFEQMLDLLRKTDLAVLKTDVKPLEKLDDAARTEVLTAFLGTLDKDGPAPFDDLLTALKRAGVKPTWTLLSSMTTLSDPSKYGPVKSATLRKQGKRLGLAASLPNQPTGQGFASAQSILQHVHDKLVQLDLHPVDKMDVADFMSKSLANA